MPGRGTSTGRYLVEIEGLNQVRSSEVNGLKETHEEFELHESNKDKPHLGRGHSKCEPVTIKHGHALNGTAGEFYSWFKNFITGADVERRGARVIELDEDGDTPINTWELQDCIPISIEQDTNTAGGKDASYFRMVIRPEDLKLV